MGLYDLLGTQDYRKELDRQVKNPKSNFKITIVVEMWLTGFEVPFLDTMYIDKPIQGHNLIQTISRVNRKFSGKEKNLVVDCIGIKKQINLALAHYNKADKQSIEEIEHSIIMVKDHLDLLNKLFHKFNATPYYKGSPVEQLNCLNMAAQYAQIMDSMEKRFMAIVKCLKAATNAVLLVELGPLDRELAVVDLKVNLLQRGLVGWRALANSIAGHCQC